MPRGTKGTIYSHTVSTRFTDEQYKMLMNYLGTSDRSDSKKAGIAVRQLVLDRIKLPKEPWKIILEILLAQNRWMRQAWRRRLEATPEAPFTVEELDDIYQTAFGDKELILLEYLNALQQEAEFDALPKPFQEDEE